MTLGIFRVFGALWNNAYVVLRLWTKRKAIACQVQGKWAHASKKVTMRDDPPGFRSTTCIGTGNVAEFNGGHP